MCVHHRFVEQRCGELTVDQLNKELKLLAKQAKSTKYRDVMKLCRLALSGLQVPEHIARIAVTDKHPSESGFACVKLKCRF